MLDRGKGRVSSGCKVKKTNGPLGVVLEDTAQHLKVESQVQIRRLDDSHSRSACMREEGAVRDLHRREMDQRESTPALRGWPRVAAVLKGDTQDNDK